MRRFALLLSLLLLAGDRPARADDDPEPPGGVGDARNLRGKWVSVRMMTKGTEKETTAYSYTFERDKFSYNSGKKLAYSGTLKVDDRKKPILLELTRDDRKTTQKMAMKIEKGELFLAQIRGEVPKEIDFTGKTGPVLVLTREKK